MRDNLSSAASNALAARPGEGESDNMKDGGTDWTAASSGTDGAGATMRDCRATISFRNEATWEDLGAGLPGWHRAASSPAFWARRSGTDTCLVTILEAKAVKDGALRL